MLHRFALVLLASVAAACASPTVASDDARSASESAFTVEDGDKFVISATPERVVLAKRVGAVSFPFDAAGLRGKALLVHPVHGKSEGGVYVRAKTVVDDVDRLVVTGAPLGLREMEHISEDDIVRIYIERARPEATTTFDLTAVSGLSRAATPVTGVTVAHEVQEAKLAPTPLAKWTPDAGLELGLRLDVSWKSKLVARGEHGGEIFRSQTVETSPFVVMVTVGPVPVPITFTASAYITCAAAVTGAFDASITFAADASVVGSVVLRDEIAPGSWPARATGTASIVPDFALKGRGVITCTIPRVDLRAAVASVAGAYLAVAPVAEISTDSVSLEAGLFAGVDARFMGFTLAKETKLLSWKAL